MIRREEPPSSSDKIEMRGKVSKMMQRKKKQKQCLSASKETRERHVLKRD